MSSPGSRTRGCWPSAPPDRSARPTRSGAAPGCAARPSYPFRHTPVARGGRYLQGGPHATDRLREAMNGATSEMFLALPFLALPFLGLLVSIALLPGLAPRFWLRRMGWVSLGWSLAMLAQVAASRGL